MPVERPGQLSTPPPPLTPRWLEAEGAKTALFSSGRQTAFLHAFKAVRVVFFLATGARRLIYPASAFGRCNRRRLPMALFVASGPPTFLTYKNISALLSVHLLHEACAPLPPAGFF